MVLEDYCLGLICCIATGVEGESEVVIFLWTNIPWISIFFSQVHLSNKVLQCRICEKDFGNQKELANHMKSNHFPNEMPYVCHLCNFKSSMYSDVVDHFKKVGWSYLLAMEHHGSVVNCNILLVSCYEVFTILLTLMHTIIYFNFMLQNFQNSFDIDVSCDKINACHSRIQSHIYVDAWNFHENFKFPRHWIHKLTKKNYCVTNESNFYSCLTG